MRVHCLILLNHASSNFDEAMQLVDASTKHIFAVFLWNENTLVLLYLIKLVLYLPGIRKIAQCRQIVLYLPGINLHVLCRKQAEENTHARPAAWISRWNQLIIGERAENRREMVILTLGSSLQLCHAALVGLGPPN